MSLQISMDFPFFLFVPHAAQVCIERWGSSKLPVPQPQPQPRSRAGRGEAGVAPAQGIGHLPGTDMGQGQVGTSAHRWRSGSGLARGTGVRQSPGIAGQSHEEGNGTRPVGDFSLWIRDRPSVFLGNCLTLHYFVKEDVKASPAATSVNQSSLLL